MREKCLIGFVIHNKNNQFLITRTIKNNIADIALVSEEVTGEITTDKLNSILRENLGLNVNSNRAEMLFNGNDLDGKFVIYSLLLDENTKFMHSAVDNKTKHMWLSYNQIVKLFNEKHLNADQLSCISKCNEKLTAEKSIIKERVKTPKKKKPLIYSNPDEEYAKYVEKHTDRRILARIINGRKIKPCGAECHEKGYLIAQSWHHSSFENFANLMDDEEFILSAAEITPNPVECGNYFYMYVNPFLKAKPEFRLKFLKQVYLNLNVYRLEDINLIVKELNLKTENETILNDLEFKKLIEKKFDKTIKSMELKYNCSGLDKKELRKYKVTANDLKIKLENIKKGLTDIVNSFKVGEKIDEPNFEPTTFYEFLCQQVTKETKQENIREEEKLETAFVEDEHYEPTTYYEFLIQQERKNRHDGFNSGL